MFPPVTHVIFDMDGLILDTEHLYTEITQKFLAPYGKEFSWEIKKQLMGRRRDEATKMMLQLYDLPLSVNEAKEKFDILYENTFPQAKLLPGAGELIRHLHRHRVPIAIATGSDRDVLRLKTQNHRDLFGLFHHTVTGDDSRISRSKPAPDAFLVTLQDFDEPPSPQQVLVLEDSCNGVEAAISAGMQCVWVPDHNVYTSDLPTKATLTLKSLADFNPASFGLPPY